MPSRSRKTFLFDLSPNEIDRNLRAVVANEMIERRAHNLPIIYKNSMCISKNEFIHEYADGRKFLISQDQHNSEEKIIRQL